MTSVIVAHGNGPLRALPAHRAAAVSQDGINLTLIVSTKGGWMVSHMIKRDQDHWLPTWILAVAQSTIRIKTAP